MPRHPDLTRAAAGVHASPFAAFQKKMGELAAAGTLIPLHIGDVCWLPPEPALALDIRDPSVHRYAPVGGLPELRAAIAGRLAGHFGMPVETDGLFVTAGATGALTVASLALLDPGEACVVLTPSWPLIFGILQSQGRTVIQVDVGDDGFPERDPKAFAARVAAAVTPETTAIYWCDPNNPSGFVYPRGHLEALSEIAVANDLWVLADAVYQDFVYDGVAFTPTATIPGLAERTVTVGSFSKAMSLAGHRVGFLAAPEKVRPLIPRLNTHTIFHTSVAGQAMALAGMADAETHLGAARATVVRGARATEQTLRVPHLAAEAGTFVLLDLRAKVADADGAIDFLRRCLDEHVSLAPGGAFGERFGRFARLCYTATSEEVLRDGIERVNRVWESL